MNNDKSNQRELLLQGDIKRQWEKPATPTMYVIAYNAARDAWRDIELLKSRKRKYLKPTTSSPEKFYQQHKHIMDKISPTIKLDYLSDYLTMYIYSLTVRKVKKYHTDNPSAVKIYNTLWSSGMEFEVWLCWHLFAIPARVIIHPENLYKYTPKELIDIYKKTGQLFYSDSLVRGERRGTVTPLDSPIFDYPLTFDDVSTDANTDPELWRTAHCQPYAKERGQHFSKEFMDKHILNRDA